MKPIAKMCVIFVATILDWHVSKIHPSEDYLISFKSISCFAQLTFLSNVKKLDMPLEDIIRSLKNI